MAHTDRTGTKQEQKTITILVADDDPEIGEFLTIALRQETNAHVLLASDAAQALELIKTVTPDLFILDYQLPGINGFELADRLATLPAYAQTPVLLISAAFPKEEREKQHLTLLRKPFELDELLRTVEHLLRT